MRLAVPPPDCVETERVSPLTMETLQTLVDDKDDDFFLPFPDLIQDVEQQDKLGGLLQDILQHMQIIA